MRHADIRMTMNIYRDVVTNQESEAHSKIVGLACHALNGSRYGSRLSQVVENMAERVGFEFTRKRSFNNIERTAGTVKQWKAVVGSANGSQTDHGSVIA